MEAQEGVGKSGVFHNYLGSLVLKFYVSSCNIWANDDLWMGAEMRSNSKNTQIAMRRLEARNSRKKGNISNDYLKMLNDRMIHLGNRSISFKIASLAFFSGFSSYSNNQINSDIHNVAFVFLMFLLFVVFLLDINVSNSRLSYERHIDTMLPDVPGQNRKRKNFFRLVYDWSVHLPVILATFLFWWFNSQSIYLERSRIAMEAECEANRFIIKGLMEQNPNMMVFNTISIPVSSEAGTTTFYIKEEEIPCDSEDVERALYYLKMLHDFNNEDEETTPPTQPLPSAPPPNIHTPSGNRAAPD